MKTLSEKVKELDEQQKTVEEESRRVDLDSNMPHAACRTAIAPPTTLR